MVWFSFTGGGPLPPGSTEGLRNTLCNNIYLSNVICTHYILFSHEIYYALYFSLLLEEDNFTNMQWQHIVETKDIHLLNSLHVEFWLQFQDAVQTKTIDKHNKVLTKTQYLTNMSSPQESTQYTREGNKI